MLRLTIAKKLQNFTTNLATSVDQTVLVNHFAKQASNVTNNVRLFSLTSVRFCKEEGEEEEESGKRTYKTHPLYKKYAGTTRDRTKVIDVQTSIDYLKSGAFQSTYGGRRVWELYRRVHKGQFPKRLTRKNCIVAHVIATGSPCPICRDEYLVLHHENLELLKMFISPHTGEIIPFDKTGLCQMQHTKLEIVVERAYDLGLLEYYVPHREFNYADYYDVYAKAATEIK